MSQNVKSALVFAPCGDVGVKISCYYNFEQRKRKYAFDPFHIAVFTRDLHPNGLHAKFAVRDYW